MNDPQRAPCTLPQATEFVLELRQWELANLSHFCEGQLSQRLFLTFALASHKRTVLRLTELFVDGHASEVGIRKRLKRYEKLGLIEIVSNPADRRTKLVRPTARLEDLMLTYFEVASKLWQKKSASTCAPSSMPTMLLTTQTPAVRC